MGQADKQERESYQSHTRTHKRWHCNFICLLQLVNVFHETEITYTGKRFLLPTCVHGHAESGHVDMAIKLVPLVIWYSSRSKNKTTSGESEKK